MPDVPHPLVSADRAEAVAAMLKAVSHPLRLQLLAALRADPLTVGDLQMRVAAPAGQVSAQLLRLRGSGLVSCTRSDTDARIMLYALADPRVVQLLDLVEGF